MKRTHQRRHIELDELDAIVDETATTGGIVRAHLNPFRHAHHGIDPRDDRHAVRRELHELERDIDALGVEP